MGGGLREMAAPFVVPGPSGVAVRDRLKHLTAEDEKVLRLAGGHLGSLASRDPKVRCAAGLDHDSGAWAERKRNLTLESSSRWAGSITKATHDQWGLARRAQLAHIQGLKRPVARFRAAAFFAAAVSLALPLTGCTTLHTTAPSAVRAHAAADAQGRFGTVDCREAKCIALTFDAGPSENSARLLDILKEKKVPATFFLLGKRHIEKYPELVKRMAAEGHEVGSHTWDHQILTRLKPEQIREELQRPNEAIEKLTGHKPTLMRPPQGRTNDTVHRISKELGLAEVLWSVTAKDYTTDDSALIQKRVLDQASRDGIILLHDLYPGTVPAVPGIIDALKKRGNVFVTVPQLLAPGKAEPGTVYRP